jgi:hypothetical protein
MPTDAIVRLIGDPYLRVGFVAVPGLSFGGAER